MGSILEQSTTDKPIEFAKGTLREALKLLHQLDDPPFDAQKAGESIAEALDTLQAVSALDIRALEQKSTIQQTMALLRDAAQEMQSDEHLGDELSVIIEPIAKTLALLYPFSKGREAQSLRPSRPISTIKDPSPFQERRASPRVSIDADIGFQSETNFYTGFSEDISSGGLFIATYDISPMGSLININFTLPDGHLVTASGKVCWVREFNDATPDTMPGMGIQFQTLSLEDKQAISRFIEQRQPMFYEE